MLRPRWGAGLSALSAVVQGWQTIGADQEGVGDPAGAGQERAAGEPEAAGAEMFRIKLCPEAINLIRKRTFLSAFPMFVPSLS